MIFRLKLASWRNGFEPLLAQFMTLFTKHKFSKIVNRRKGDRHAIKFNCRNQFLLMSLSQFADRNGLKDIKTTLDLCSQDLYRSRLKVMSKFTLAEADKKRMGSINQDFGYILVQKAKNLSTSEKLRSDLNEMVCAFDSSTIVMCFSLYPCATLHHGKGGLKMHTLMDLNISIPTFIHHTDASVHDSKILEEVPMETNVYFLMDNGYVKFDTLYTYFHQMRAGFVMRAEGNMKYEVMDSRSVDLQTRLISDETIRLTGCYTSRKHTIDLSLVVYEGSRDVAVYRFLINNFSLETITITELYREGWQIKIFVKGIERHLHIKSFYNTTMNAILTQIWMTIFGYILLIIVQKQYGLNPNLHLISISIGQILFNRGNIRDIYNKPDAPINIP